MKWMGAFLLLSAGYLLGRRLAWPEVCHVELLSEGEFLFRVLESEIRSGKIPLPELFEDLARRTDSPWRPFFASLAEKLRKGSDLQFADTFAQTMENNLAGTLTEEERQLFLRAGRNLLSDDLLFHRDASEKLSEDIRRHVAEKEKELESRKKVLMALCLSGAALLVILLF